MLQGAHEAQIGSERAEAETVGGGVDTHTCSTETPETPSSEPEDVMTPTRGVEGRSSDLGSLEWGPSPASMGRRVRHSGTGLGILGADAGGREGDLGMMESPRGRDTTRRCVRACACARVRARVCVRACACAGLRFQVRARQKRRHAQRQKGQSFARKAEPLVPSCVRARARACVRACVCVCMCMCVCVCVCVCFAGATSRRRRSLYGREDEESAPASPATDVNSLSTPPALPPRKDSSSSSRDSR